MDKNSTFEKFEEFHVEKNNDFSNQMSPGQHTLANFRGIWYINGQERVYIWSNLQSPAKDRQCK